MDWLWKDLAYGARGLRKQPGFTGVAIVTLALGIGAAATIFSAIQNILLDPFPYTDARSVVAVQIHDNSNARPGGRTFYRTDEFLDLQEQTRSFGEVIGGSGDDVLWNSGEGTEQFSGGFVTPNTFQSDWCWSRSACSA
jgi:putative ABC transport system permease protein